MATIVSTPAACEFFDATDVYNYVSDNRPLQHLLDNDIAINTELEAVRDEVVDARDSDSFGAFADLDTRLENLELDGFQSWAIVGMSSLILLDPGSFPSTFSTYPYPYRYLVAYKDGIEPAWAGHAGDIAEWDPVGNQWVFFTPKIGDRVVYWPIITSDPTFNSGVQEFILTKTDNPEGYNPDSTLEPGNKIWKPVLRRQFFKTLDVTGSGTTAITSSYMDPYAMVVLSTLTGTTTLTLSSGLGNSVIIVNDDDNVVGGGEGIKIDVVIQASGGGKINNASSYIIPPFSMKRFVCTGTDWFTDV